jgi:transposase
MMRPDANVAVYVCVTPVDMRKQATTLALLVEQALKKNIFEPGLYVFSNHRRDRIKIVYWQRNGRRASARISYWVRAYEQTWICLQVW